MGNLTPSGIINALSFIWALFRGSPGNLRLGEQEEMRLNNITDIAKQLGFWKIIFFSLIKLNPVKHSF